MVMLQVCMLGCLLAGCARQEIPASHPASTLTTVAPGPRAEATSAARPSESPARVEAPKQLAATSQASPAPEPLVALATADAARRAGARPDDVRIVRIEPREWPDRSLGCPRPGMGYAQAITPGYLIVAEGAGQQFEYHTDHAQIVLCAS
jgi:hypothetical protein